MEARAVSRYVRISPRKARQVIDLVRGRAVEKAFHILQFTPKKAAQTIERTLRSAVANAVNHEEASSPGRGSVCQGGICQWGDCLQAHSSPAPRGRLDTSGSGAAILRWSFQMMCSRLDSLRRFFFWVQKTHPIGFRLGIAKDWSSRWFAGSDFADLAQRRSDAQALYQEPAARRASVSVVDIERAPKPGDHYHPYCSPGDCYWA